MNISRFVEVNNKKLHFYKSGKGPALIMLHPSPSSGETMLPLAKHLASHYTVFCVDTPGYGMSDPLTEKPSSLSNYTKFLHEAFEKIGLSKPSIYGSATGAQLAVRYGIEYPESVSNIFLDNSAHFNDNLADKILEDYFPDLTPQLDGSHITQIWTIVSHMFQYFPWCFTSEEYALNRPQMPLFVLQMVALDFIKAGKTYDLAYKLAFQHERGSYVQQLKVSTTIFRWNNSIITKYVDDLLAFDFKENINGFYIDGDAVERTNKMVSYMQDKAFDSNLPKLNEEVIKAPVHSKLTYNYSLVNLPEPKSNGQHLQEIWQDLVLNNPNESATTIQDFMIDRCA